MSVRYDSFRLHDLDGGRPSPTRTVDGVTLAYHLQLGLRHRVGAEYIWLDSDAPASATR